MKKLLFLILFVCAHTSVVIAQENNANIAINAGVFDALDSDNATELGVEYRFAPLSSFYDIIPAVGVAMNSDGSYWAHAGIRYDMNLSQNWLITPHFSVAGYEQGGGKDLGLGLEFRSGIEIAYKLDNGRLGLGVYHLSNAGLGDTNPGEESVYLTYGIDLPN